MAPRRRWRRAAPGWRGGSSKHGRAQQGIHKDSKGSAPAQLNGKVGKAPLEKLCAAPRQQGAQEKGGGASSQGAAQGQGKGSVGGQGRQHGHLPWGGHWGIVPKDARVEGSSGGQGKDKGMAQQRAIHAARGTGVGPLRVGGLGRWAAGKGEGQEVQEGGAIGPRGIAGSAEGQVEAGGGL